MQVENKYQNGGIIKWTLIRVGEGETLTLYTPNGKETYTNDKRVYKIVAMAVHENVTELRLTDINDIDTKKVFSNNIAWLIE